MSNQDYRPFYRYNNGYWEELSQEEQDAYGFFGLFVLWLQSIGVWLCSLAVFIFMAWFTIELLKAFFS